jgi:hypothetical protein
LNSFIQYQIAAVMSFNIIQEEMQFEDGFLGVVQPIHATVGIETR